VTLIKPAWPMLRVQVRGPRGERGRAGGAGTRPERSAWPGWRCRYAARRAGGTDTERVQLIRYCWL